MELTEERLKAGFKELVGTVKQAGILESVVDRGNTLRRRRRVLRVAEVIGAVAVIALTAWGVSWLVRDLPPVPVVETPTSVRPATIVTTGQDRSNVPATLIAPGYAQVRGMTSDYILYRCPSAADGGRFDSEWSDLCVYRIGTGSIELLSTTLASVFPQPSISGNRVAWVGDNNGQQAILIRDLTTGETRTFAISGDSPTFLLLRGDLLLAEQSVSAAPAMELDLYDVVTGEKTQVARVPTGESVVYGEDGYTQADMDGRHVVWSAGEAASREVYCYELATGVTTRLTDDAVNDFKPHVTGDLVTWLSGYEASAAVCVRDLSSGVTSEVGHGVQTNLGVGGNGVSAFAGGPLTDGRYVVWWQTPDMTTETRASQIMLYDAKTGETANLSAGNAGDGAPRLLDGHVVWIRWKGDTAETTQIIAQDVRSNDGAEVVAEGRVTDPDTNGSQVAWFEYESTSGPQEQWVPAGLQMALVPAFRPQVDTWEPTDDPALPREDSAGRSPADAVLALMDARQRRDWHAAYSLYAQPEGDYEIVAAEWEAADELYQDFLVRETRVLNENLACVRVTYRAQITPPGGQPCPVVVEEPGEWWRVEKAGGLWKVGWLARQ